MFLFLFTKRRETKEEEMPVVKTLKDYQNVTYLHREDPFSRLKIIVRRLFSK
ncbi:MAG: hypothetical protein K0B81_02015 [Candidatus Cloacimonetes bacterium]|nr:hypothetical protein [Candidatus Cloacimonadota bacterium]